MSKAENILRDVVEMLTASIEESQRVVEEITERQQRESEEFWEAHLAEKDEEFKSLIASIRQARNR